MAEEAARRLQALIATPSGAFSVYVWDLGNNDCELRIWFDEDWMGSLPAVPNFFDGFSVRIEERPRHQWVN